jgi:hypothetical protein
VIVHAVPLHAWQQQHVDMNINACATGLGVTNVTNVHSMKRKTRQQNPQEDSKRSAGTCLAVAAFRLLVTSTERAGKFELIWSE